MKKVLLISIFILVAGCASVSTKNPSEEELLLLANEGDLESVHSLCYGYIYGRNNLKKDYSKAYLWCERSAILGSPSSQTLFAEIHYSGKGVPVDYEKSFYWYSLAAEQNHQHALLMMYFHYHDGQGVEKDDELAHQYLNRSACLGHEKAIKVLGDEQPICAEKI